MAFQINKRSLNKNEKFVCSPNDVKLLFSEFDLHVSFGHLGRNFTFDSRDTKHPNISGIVVASASVHANTHNNFLCFYVIKDSDFTIQKAKEFSEICLPKIYNWFEKSLQRADTEILGALSSKVFIIELRENEFYFYDYHF